MQDVKAFRGLNNVSDPVSLGLDWLVQADNVDVTDAGKIVARTGYGLGVQADSLTGGFATRDEQRAYIVDDGELLALVGPPTSLSTVTLQSGLASDPMRWAEVNGDVYFNNGTDSGIIKPDNTVLPWRIAMPPAPTLTAVAGDLPAGQYLVRLAFVEADGRMGPASNFSAIDLDGTQDLRISGIPQTASTSVFICPANSPTYNLAIEDAPAAFTWSFGPDALGRELTMADLDPLPLGCDVIQEWGGRMYASEWMPQEDQSVVWCSLPLAFHLFDLEEGFFLVPGRVLMMGRTPQALVIGTDREILAYGKDKSIARLAPYGVVPGNHWSPADDDKAGYFWSVRGTCRALPFANVHADYASVAPGVRAGAGIVEAGGQKHFIVALEQGGTAFNSLT